MPIALFGSTFDERSLLEYGAGREEGAPYEVPQLAEDEGGMPDILGRGFGGLSR